MTVGDPRKAVVLAVIALVVVCAAVYRALPSAPAALPAVPSASTELVDSDTSEAADIAEAVAVDPFSHPDLDSEAKPASDQPDEGNPPPPTELRKQQVEALRQRPQTDLSNDVFGPLPPVNPMDRQLKDANAIKFSVEAVVRGDESMALVSIASHSNIAVRAGTVLNGHVTVKAIHASSVVISVSGKTLEVTVGDHIVLP